VRQTATPSRRPGNAQPDTGEHPTGGIGATAQSQCRHGQLLMPTSAQALATPAARRSNSHAGIPVNQPVAAVSKAVASKAPSTSARGLAAKRDAVKAPSR
jgi:hypothetical protein